jgi:hypothetical protein
MKRAHEVIAALAFALALSGCGTMVVGGGGGGSDPGDQGEPVTAAGDEPSAVAMRFSQWTLPEQDPSSLFDFQIHGATPDPDSLVLFYASKAQACPQPFLELPNPGACDQRGLWQIIVIIPPDRAQPGVIDLQDQSLAEYRSVWSCNGGGSGNGPGFIPGKLTITSIDATEVVTKLELEPSTGWEGESGDYTATFCP